MNTGNYSKFSNEISLPEYVDHFYSPDSAMKEGVLSLQQNLYKGINTSLINAVYDKLCVLSLAHPELYVYIQVRSYAALKDIQPLSSKFIAIAALCVSPDFENISAMP